MYSPSLQTLLIQARIEDLAAARYVSAHTVAYPRGGGRAALPASVIRAIRRWVGRPVIPASPAIAGM